MDLVCNHFRVLIVWGTFLDLCLNHYIFFPHEQKSLDENHELLLKSSSRFEWICRWWSISVCGIHLQSCFIGDSIDTVETASPGAGRGCWIPVELSAGLLWNQPPLCRRVCNTANKKWGNMRRCFASTAFIPFIWLKQELHHIKKKMWILNKDVKQTAPWLHETRATVPMLQRLQGLYM